MDTHEYVSNLLCHFVGRSLSSDEDRYSLLKKIIAQDCVLITDSSNPQNFFAKLETSYKGENQGELLSQCYCVCFCDIPNESLSIHRAKYSSFGIGFSKSFLASQGTRPVMYVPKNCTIQDFETENALPPFDYYIPLAHQIPRLMELVIALNEIHPFTDELAEYESELARDHMILPLGKRNRLSATANVFKDHRNGIFFCERIIRAWVTQCAYIKVYDESLPDDDLDNYYMEHEWRCLHNVSFTLKDIDTIYLPDASYKARFQEDIPEYGGNFCTFDSFD